MFLSHGVLDTHVEIRCVNRRHSESWSVLNNETVRFNDGTSWKQTYNLSSSERQTKSSSFKALRSDTSFKRDQPHMVQS